VVKAADLTGGHAPTAVTDPAFSTFRPVFQLQRVACMGRSAEGRGAERRARRGCGAERRGAERRGATRPVQRGWGVVGRIEVERGAVRSVPAANGARDASESDAPHARGGGEAWDASERGPAQRVATQRDASHRRAGTCPRGLGPVAPRATAKRATRNARIHATHRTGAQKSARWTRPTTASDPSDLGRPASDQSHDSAIRRSATLPRQGST